MPPEILAFLGTITFNTALLIAVYTLYTDNRADAKAAIKANTESNLQLAIQIQRVLDKLEASSEVKSG